jgi:hypothetical protein
MREIADTVHPPKERANRRQISPHFGERDGNVGKAL